MAKRRKVKKNVATKVGTGGKVKSSEQSTLEKGVKKVSSCVESPQPCQPSGAEVGHYDRRFAAIGEVCSTLHGLPATGC